MCPPGGRLVSGNGGYAERAKMVCHCLLVETERDGLVLVDTGFGLEDVGRMWQRHGAIVALLSPRCDPEETAIRQVEALGFRRSDVRNVVVTHLDLDHAGGLPDFPDATVHLLAAEKTAALAPRTLLERRRYFAPHFSHGPRWETYEARGERWKGFECVRELRGLPPEILLVPLGGHSRGHAAVAVDAGGGWLLHCGDAYFNHAEIDTVRRSCPAGLAAFQRIVAVDDRLRVENQRRIRDLARAEGTAVRIFCAHDPVELERMQAERPPAQTSSISTSRT
jgi:glyoxylase-like metal-dependent hydrolase (beta-lactamase superfamily II)